MTITQMDWLVPKNKLLVEKTPPSPRKLPTDSKMEGNGESILFFYELFDITTNDVNKVEVLNNTIQEHDKNIPLQKKMLFAHNRNHKYPR